MDANWLLHSPLDGVIFDCDSTLCTIEGIDELARHSPHFEAICDMTNRCMSTQGLSESVYEERLKLIKPTRTQLTQLGQQYIHTLTPGAIDVIEILHTLGKHVFIVSSGLRDAILSLGEAINISPDAIYAVDLAFDSAGHYLDFDHENPLVRAGGKRTLVEKIKLMYPRLALIGDGMSDYEASPALTRFIGYGGICERERVKQLSQFYIRSQSLLPLLPLCLTPAETVQLTAAHKHVYKASLAFIQNQFVICKE